jgi:hypothetical protein
LFSFTFSPSITLGGWLGGALLWHFRRDVAADGQRPVYLSARSCHRPLPQEAAADHARGVIADTKAALTGKLVA